MMNETSIDGTFVNVAFDNTSENVNVDVVMKPANGNSNQIVENNKTDIETGKSKSERPQWGNGLEFLMSCISMSVGLGNVWRFPFTAYENGGGAFLIPYIIILILVGKPLYYMEMIVGQFSSRASVKVWEIVPAFRGIAVGQLVGITCVVTYYSSLIALTISYMFKSFALELPWSTCSDKWTEKCINASSLEPAGNHSINASSSTELYFQKEIIKEIPYIDNGIGTPDLELTCWLFIAWVCLFMVMFKGVKSSGKVAYFTALFPYVVLIILLIRACTLEGAGKGIMFFISPKYEKLLEPQVWYQAVTQMFFSLGMGIGNVIVFSSYNKFDHNIYRDALIVTSIDTLTSLLAGFTIFGILGNLAHNLGVDDIKGVIKGGGSSLAFISYPEAISKFQFLPQLFAILFFFMLFVLGMGSGVANTSTIITNIMDQLPKGKFKYWQVTGAVSIFGFLVGLVYVTPGGQWILTLVDYFGGNFIVFALAILQGVGLIWIYGLENFCWDVEFMLCRKVSAYWRISWGIITPGILIIIFIYNMANFENPTYAQKAFPEEYLVAGWVIFIIGVSQVLIWFIWSINKEHKEQKDSSLKSLIKSQFTPSSKWGPKDAKLNEDWRNFKAEAKKRRDAMVEKEEHTWIQQKIYLFTGKYGTL